MILKECPHTKDTNFICRTLVTEMLRAQCLADRVEIAQAILAARFAEKSLVAEWEHLNGDQNAGTNAAT